MTPRKIRPATALSRAVLTGSALLAGSVLLTGCLHDGGRQPAAAPKSSPAPHGYVEGAEETAEPQPRLVLADAGTGAVGVLDLITGDITRLKRTDGVRGLLGDGRFAHLRTDGATHTVDTGSWTVDHGDHVHYYRAAIREVGRIVAAGAAHVHSDQAVTAVSPARGAGELFDREGLEGGTVPRGKALPGTDGAAIVPYEQHLLVAPAGAGRDAVEVRDRDGARVATLDEPCAEARGAAVTRRGVVFGCADGALLVSEDKGRFGAEKIAYGEEVSAADRAVDFRHRAGSTTLAARSGDDAVWILDVTDRAWTRIRTGPVVAANTAGEGAPLLALGGDGVLTAYDIATGKRTVRKELLTKGAAPGATSAVIEIDTTRAYVNDAAAEKVYEIDYNDGLRLARTFPLGFAPTYMVETGR
ncbi:hypothetical protein OG705_02455 [Streptomyces sp. NBC_00838]|uniref:hypothetical protein n=1 Tax=Streptomyces sp. NBC_00838 TaxID=2903680 RepID=UPI00386C4631|nr:hypothetical protein OG705_02455 [Streptomyces sp. NBC_00838]